MKIFLLSACVAAGLALVGCSADQPIFQSEASAQKAVNGTNAGPLQQSGMTTDAQQTNRDIANYNHSAAGLQGMQNQPFGTPTDPRIQMNENSPYGH